jgi:hypothetical protein
MKMRLDCKGDIRDTSLVKKPQVFGKTGRNRFFVGRMFAGEIIGEWKENKPDLSLDPRNQ